MSSAELQPFFPSATHSAIPIAANILSTLRALTAPGKGNDLKPEERAALVGVSALLGCERVQSNDLIELSAQRLASVAPAHFKTALATSRRLMSTAAAESSRRSRTTSTTSSPTRSPTHTQTQTAPSPSALANVERSPFQTPKKKFKYSSGVDLGGLLTPHRHTPASASPLRQSVTPTSTSKCEARDRALAAIKEGADNGDEFEDDAEEEEDAHADVRTPTKRTPRATLPRMPGSRTSTGSRTPTGSRTHTPTTLQDRLAAARKAKERDGTAAFLAMRPGGPGASNAAVAAAADSEGALPATVSRYGYDPMLASLGLGGSGSRELGGMADLDAPRRVRRLRKRADWTFRERTWSRPRVADVWAQLGLDPEPETERPAAGPVPEIPDLIVTDDEDEETVVVKRARKTPNTKTTTPKGRTPNSKTPKSSGGRGKRSTPRSRATQTPRKSVLDGMIVAAWA